MAVQAELAPDRVLERAGQEVGQEVSPRLVGQRRRDLLAGEHVVAVVAGQPRQSELVQRAAGAAVGIGERDHVVALAQERTAGAICSGRLCSSASTGTTSISQPRRRAIERTSNASAPHEITAARRLIPGTRAGR